MRRRTLWLLLIASVLAVAPCFAQSDSQDSSAPPNQAPPRSPSESSSKDTRIDLTPPAGDAAMHPNSEIDDVMEMRPYNPHKAEKDVEVGDFYFKRANYRAALDRYTEALEYKPNDAEATYKIALTHEKLGQLEDALASYQGYLKILPEGPHAEEAKKAIEQITNPAADRAADKKEAKKEKKKKGS